MTPPSPTVLDPCNNRPAQLAFSAVDNRGGPGRFHYYLADNGLLFLDNVPDNLGDYYAGGFQPIPRDLAELDTAAKVEEHKIDQLRRYVDGGDYLEIGPWIGLAARNAQKAGFSVTTLEMNSQCVDLMRSAGMNAIQTEAPLETLAAMDACFDAIVMWHSIEHVPQPWRLIELAARRLNPGGVLLVAAPNPESAQARYFGAKWYHLDAPRHINLVPMSMVEGLAEQAGLVLRLKTTDDELGLMFERQGWEWPTMRFRQKLPVGKFVFARVSMAIGALLWRRNRKKENDGAAYTLIFQRPRNRPTDALD